MKSGKRMTEIKTKFALYAQSSSADPSCRQSLPTARHTRNSGRFCRSSRLRTQRRPTVRQPHCIRRFRLWDAPMPHGYPMIRRQGTTGGLICRSIERFDCAGGRFPFKRVSCFLSDKSRILFIARQRPTAERKDGPYTRLCPNPRRVPRFPNPLCPAHRHDRRGRIDKTVGINQEHCKKTLFYMYCRKIWSKRAG